jgi:hypothetical protein
MWDSGSIIRLPDDPEQLQAYFRTLPREVVEQFVKNRRASTDPRERNAHENRFFDAMVRSLETEK